LWYKKDRARIYEAGTDFLKIPAEKRELTEQKKKPETDEHKKL
jgi:hypothetical protein